MPALNLYVADLRHPSVAGSYLAARTTYATLFKASPVDLKYTAGLDPAIARYLQTVARETVQEYFQALSGARLVVSALKRQIPTKTAT